MTGSAYSFTTDYGPESVLDRCCTTLGWLSSESCNLHLPVPPEQEQKDIANHIGIATADNTAAISRAHRQIELLQEYRTRLIADVVTGKLDVREAAAQLPDEADD